MASGKRPGQVGDLVRAELAALIQREIRDPREFLNGDTS